MSPRTVTPMDLFAIELPVELRLAPDERALGSIDHLIAWLQLLLRPLLGSLRDLAPIVGVIACGSP